MRSLLYFVHILLIISNGYQLINLFQYGDLDYTRVVIILPLAIISGIAIYYFSSTKKDHYNFNNQKSDPAVLDSFNRKVSVMRNPTLDLIETLLIIHGAILILVGIYRFYGLYKTYYLYDLDNLIIFIAIIVPSLYCIFGMIQITYIRKMSKFRSKNQ